MAAPLPPDEPRRLEALRRYWDTIPQQDTRFDRISRLAAWTFDVPVALVTLIDADWQHFQGCYGLEMSEPYPRELAFCSHTILADEVMVVEDATQDERFVNHPMVTGETHLRFYAGAPLITSAGDRLGTLCLVAPEPRAFSTEEAARLKDLAALVVDELELSREIDERQGIEEALRASEAQFRALNEHALDVVAILNPAAELTYVTPSVEHTLGYTVSELVGQNVLEMLYPGDVPQAQAALQACLDHPDEAQHVEVRFEHRNGTPRWLSIKARNLLDHEGIGGVLLNVSNVTKRHEAEQEVQRAKQKYESLFATANDPILIFEPEHEVILEANAQACAFYGYERDELVGTSLHTLSRDPEARQDDVERTLQEGRIQNLETVHVRRDGTAVHMLVSATRIEYDGRTAILSINRDVSERRAAREALQRSEDKFRTLVEQTNDWIWEVDTSFHFTYVSPQAERILGYAPDELTGRSAYALMEEIESERFAERVTPYLEAHESFSALKKKLRHRDGHEVVLETSGTPITDASGTLRGYRGIARDVTERERREEQLRMLQSVVVNANDSVVVTEAEPFDEPGPRILYVNEAFCENTGYRPEELIGQTPRIMQGPKTDRAALDKVRQALEQWEPVRVELENYRKDGSTFWIEMVVVPVADETGWFTHWVSIQRDITERKRTEQLREGQNRLLEMTAAGRPLDEVLHELALFIEHLMPETRASVLLLDHEAGTFRIGAAPSLPPSYRSAANGGALTSRSGPCASAALEGRSFFSDDLLTDARWQLDAAFLHEHDLRTCTTVPILAQDGTSVGAFALFHDGSAPARKDVRLVETMAARIASIAIERHRSEEALRRSEERFRSLVANLPGIVYRCTYDEHWHTLYMSESFNDVLGYGVDEFKDDPGFFKELILEDDLPRVHQAVRRAMEEDQPFEVEYRIRHADGSVVWLYDVGRVFTDGTQWWLDGFMLDVTERKEQEQRLRILEKAINDATESVVITDAEMDRPGPRILYVNPGFERMSGYTAEDVLGRTPRLLQGEQTDRALMDHLRDQLEAGERFFGETINYRKDGTPFNIEWSISPVRDDDGQTTHYVAVQRDITERKRAEKELLRISTAVAVSSDGIAIVGPDRRIIYHNEALNQLVGYTSEELNEMGGPDAVYEDSTILQKMVEAVRNGESWTGEVTLRNREQGRRIVSMRVDGIHSPDGEPLGAIAVHTDVTERRRAERRLQASEERYRSVVTSVKDVVFQTDAEGRWSFLNPAWTDVTGFPVAETVGQPFLEYVHPEDRERNARLFQPLIDGEKDYCRHEVRYLTRDGGFRWIEVFARLTHDDRGRATGTSGTLHDVTERRRAMDALQQTLERERELSELKSRFVSMASHELRTPLATIQSSTELIERFRARWDREKVDKHLHRILTNVQDMTALLEDVLLLGRAGSDRLPYEPERLVLRPFVANLVEEMQTGLGARHHIVFDVDAVGLEADVDDTLLRLVINNLMTNAIKYSPEGTAVRVGLRREADEVVLAVEDSGIGIPESDQERLFEPFHRASNVGARRGTGLGLSIVHRAVEMHGGRIDVDSRVGDGTTFAVRLPLRQPAAPTLDERPPVDA